MIVYTCGTWELFHFGHVNLLKQCKRIAGKEGLVVVGVNTDSFIKKYKKVLPVMSLKERRLVLRGCGYVDIVVDNIGEEDNKKTIEHLEKELNKKVDMVVIGSDWHKRDYLKQMDFTWDWLRKKNINLCYVPYTSEISSTEIKQRLKGK